MSNENDYEIKLICSPHDGSRNDVQGLDVVGVVRRGVGGVEHLELNGGVLDVGEHFCFA